MDSKNFAELERHEDKYILDLNDLSEIEAEIAKHLPPAYPDSSTKFVMINSIYLDTPDREFFRHHAYDKQERMKVRIRKYGPNGKWNDKDNFLEIKEKNGMDVRKTRIQLDKENLERAKNGRKIEFNDDLERLNTPLYTQGDLNRFIAKFNRIVDKHKLEPTISVTYKRLAYGKGALRMTLDTNLRFDVIKTLPLSRALNVKKSVDWKDAKSYGRKYTNGENAIFEVKHESSAPPLWVQDLLAKHNLSPERFSKYMWGTFHSLDYMLGN